MVTFNANGFSMENQPSTIKRHFQNQCQKKKKKKRAWFSVVIDGECLIVRTMKQKSFVNV